MKVRNKILIGLGISVATILVALVLSANSLGKYAILKYGPEFTGRKIELEKIDLNIFSAKAKLQNFKIYEKDGKTLFFSIDKLDVDLSIKELFSKKIKIQGLGLENPKINIKKIGDKYNFVDIIENIQKKSKNEKSTAKKDNDLTISELQLNNLNFEYKDNLMEEKFKIKIDNFYMPQMEINKDINLSFTLLSKGNLELKTAIKINETKAEIMNDKFYLNFDSILPFIKTMMSVSKFSGEFSGSSKISIDFPKGGVDISGKSSYKNIEIVSLDNESMVKVGKIDLDVKKISTLTQELFIDSLKITKPEINLELYKKGINLQKLLKGESRPLVFIDYRLNKFIIEKGKLNFVDSKKNEKFSYNFSNIDLSTSPIEKTKEGFIIDGKLNLNNEISTLSTKIDIKDNKFQNINFDISAKQIKLEDFTHYIKDSINISSLKGNYSGDLRVKYKQNGKTPYINISGNSQLDSFVLIDKRQSAEILNLKSIKIDIAEISIPENRYVINSIDVDKLKLYAYIAKDGNTMQLLFPLKDKKSEKKDGGKPLNFLLKSFSFKNGNLKFSDDTFTKPFTYILDIPNASAKNISSKKDNSSIYKIDAITNKTGKVNVSGNIRVGKEFETDTKFRITNLDFGDFKQISEKYSNFITNKGILNYEGSFVLKNRQIKSENNAKILNIDIGEKEKILPLGVSINFVLSIIENKHGEVTIILPVEGDLNNPTFSYKKTLWIALKNMFVNIATAPFKFMNSDEEDNMDALQNLDVELLKKSLPESSIKKLEKIAKILKNKKMLKFEFVQVLDEENEYEMMVMKNIKTKFYMAKKEIKELVEADYVEIGNIADSDAELVSYINSKSSSFLGSNELNLLKKSELILGKENMEKEFSELYNSRNSFIAEKMKELGIEDPKKVKIRFAAKDESGEIKNARYLVKASSIEIEN